VIRAVEMALAHVRNVEQAGEGAGVQVFGEDAGSILDRHFVAGERGHARDEFDVQRVERRSRKSSIRHRSPGGCNEANHQDSAAARAAGAKRRPLCPLT
jgi:hypothetical protein